ncbi:SDR family oxidoreductase [Reinekea sp. G2M2-21]|uniref:SDR family oxidoreductase n=1 Tax=Reinekea sp. G2M2-21 TaxID=2788942 RepID=UPI0018AC0BAD|nr:SDR family oxidoreductase [Reinekea sp. G2M2-21]
MKTVVITGGASGLGLAMAVQWAKTGATLCLVDRADDNKSAAIAAVENAGGKAFFFQCDVTSDEQVTQLKQFTDAQLPPVDILINSAGVPTAGTFSDESISAWQWVLDINLLGTVRVTKAYVDDFRKRQSGHIVNVASQAGLTSMPLMGSYNATKAAVIALSETLKLELAPFGVGVSVLCPAFVSTNLHTSLHEEQKAMQDVVTKLVQTGNVSAEQVAVAVFDAVAQNRFLIVTHREGRNALRLKRWLPSLYFRIMTKRTERFTRKGYGYDRAQ